MRTAVLTLTLGAAILFPIAAAAQGGFETPPVVAPASVLPATVLRSGHHRVLDDTRVRGYALEFDIESSYGTYRARGIPMAALRAREVDVLAQAVEHFERSNVRLGQELRGQLEVGAESFVDILAAPLSTTSKLVGQLTSNVGQTLGEMAEGPAGEPAGTMPGDYARLEQGDPIVASHKRAVARQLGLDVYSSNPQVQRFLDRVARARSAGQRTAGMLSVSRPHDGAPRVAGGRLDEAVNTAIARRTPTELYRYEEGRLAGVGIDDDLLHRFLGQRMLSPRHKGTIVEFLLFLEGVAGREALLTTALDARDEAEALAAVQSARMIARYHQEVDRITELRAAADVLLGRSAGGILVAALPFDYVYWDERAERTFAGLASYSSEHGHAGLELLVSGLVSPRAARELGLRGIRVRTGFRVGGD